MNKINNLAAVIGADLAKRTTKALSNHNVVRIVVDDEGLMIDPKSGVVVSRHGQDRGVSVAGRKVVKTKVGEALAEDGSRARVARTVDTLSAMNGKGTLSFSQHQAGLRFQNDFDVGGWAAIRGMRFEAMPPAGDGGDGRTVRVVQARGDILKAMKALGGENSACGVAAWHVLGMRMSLREVAKMSPHGRIEVWTGIFIGMLGVLAMHYGLERDVSHLMKSSR